MASLPRALVVSAIATGVLALVLKKTSRPAFPPPVRPVPLPPPRPRTAVSVETDALTEAQRDALLGELAQQY